MKPILFLNQRKTLLGLRFSAKARKNQNMTLLKPQVTQHEGIWVVRDDLLPGGTKSRFISKLFQAHDEIVYPSSTWGGAQVALAYCAKLMGKKATIFVPKREQLHPRTLDAIQIAGGDPNGFKPVEKGQRSLDTPHLKVIQVPMGFLNVLKARAQQYVNRFKNAYYLDVGANVKLVEDEIAKIAHRIETKFGPFHEVWCAVGSGVLLRGLQKGFQHNNTQFFGVQVGMDVENLKDVNLIRYPKKLDKAIQGSAPFPSCPHYDLKAWKTCVEQHGPGKILFWNVMGPPSGLDPSL